MSCDSNARMQIGREAADTMISLSDCRHRAWALLVSSAFTTLVPAGVRAQNTMAISPDGRWIAYAFNDTLRVADTRGGSTPVVISAVKTYFSVPRWSWSGDRLAYYSTASGSGQLWVWDAATQTSKQLSTIEGGISPHPYGRFSGYVGDPLRFDWSPDGTRIVFAHQVVVDSAKSPPASGSAVSVHRPPPPESLAAGRPLVLTRTTPRSWTMLGVLGSRTA